MKPVRHQGGRHEPAKAEEDEGTRTARGAIGSALGRELDKIDRLIRSNKLSQAQRELEPLCARYPNREEPLVLLAHVCQKSNHQANLQYACERLLKLRPRDRDVTLMLAGSSLLCGRAAAARSAFLRFLAQWPNDPMAEDVRLQVQDIERHTHSYLDRYGLPDQQMWELAEMHERVQTHLSRHQPQRARELAERLVARVPDFIPGWNNLSLALFYLGDIGGAIAASQRVLQLEPDNFQALSNLIRCLALAGRRDEALELAPRLKAAQSEDPDLFAKKAEALSILSDDPGMLELLHQAESQRPLALRQDALLLHYAAVAAARLEDESRAKALWRRALQLDPGLDLARENLDDLAGPAEMRQGPWAFNLPNLCPKTWLDRLQPPHSAARGNVGPHLRSVLEHHPEIVAAATVALEVGDSAAVDLFIALASDSKLPALLEIVKAFGFGQRGSFFARSKAVYLLGRQGRLPAGPVRMWHNGEWHETSVLHFEISGEATTHHAPAVEKLTDAARHAMNRGDLPAAERIWRQAIELAPDKPDLMNNLATILKQQGRDEEAQDLFKEMLRQHPDYLFARTNVAHLLIEQGKVEEARDLLTPLYERHRLHVSEFIGLAGAWLNVLAHQGQPEAARPWLETWEKIAPDHPQLHHWRRQFAAGRKGKLRESKLSL